MAAQILLYTQGFCYIVNMEIISQKNQLPDLSKINNNNNKHTYVGNRKIEM